MQVTANEEAQVMVLDEVLTCDERVVRGVSGSREEWESVSGLSELPGRVRSRKQRGIRAGTSDSWKGSESGG